jgi:hypothetical protein
MHLRHPLAREIAVVLVVKVLALAALYFAFFSPAHRPEVTPEIMERAILGADSAVVPGRPSPAAAFRPTESRRTVHHV